MQSVIEKDSRTSLYLLAIGAFAIGTEGFMIAGILPDIAGDLSVTTAKAGQLVTVFALAYALCSPILTALTGNLDRRTLLIASMSVFALSNFLASFAEGFVTLMAARVLLAVAAGLYMPGAFALASSIVVAARRGRALAVVNAGITAAIALGVPLGTVISAHYGWRSTFLAVAVLASFAVIGLHFGLPRGIGNGIPVASLEQRFAVMKQPAVLQALLMTTLWSTGTYVIYTYLGTFLGASTLLSGSAIGIGFLLWGVAAAVGVFIGGFYNDKSGSVRVIMTGLPVLAMTLTSLSVIAHWLSPETSALPLLAGIMIWGVTAWAIHPAQQARLIQISENNVAQVALSLNASFLYLGFALGSALGALTLSHTSSADLGWVGGLCEVGACLLMWSISRRRRIATRSITAL